MKRTQQSVILGLLALSLAACSYMPWKNTNSTSPSASPSSGSSTSGSTGSSTPPNDPGPNAGAGGKNNSSAVGATGEN